MKIRLILAALTSLATVFFSVQSSAQTQPISTYDLQSSKDQATITICSIEMYSNSSSAIIEPCGGWNSRSGCQNGWLIWDTTAPGGQGMYSAALTAFATKSKVTVETNGTCSGFDVTTLIRLTSN